MNFMFWNFQLTTAIPPSLLVTSADTELRVKGRNDLGMITCALSVLYKGKALVIYVQTFYNDTTFIWFSEQLES